MIILSSFVAHTMAGLAPCSKIFFVPLQKELLAAIGRRVPTLIEVDQDHFVDGYPTESEG